jgi:CheY-like chemotaxis protein/HPt (histidine-containing phosphotransfer) domain-containing protein/PAS domain-containing protein
MAKVWKAYVGQLKEQLELINETLALSQKTAVDRSSTLMTVREHLRSLIRERLKTQPSAAYTYNELISSLEIAGVGHTGLGIIAVDAAARVTHFNATAEQSLGIALLTAGAAELDQAFFLADRVTPSGRNLPWRRAAEGLEVLESQIFVKRAEVPDGFWLQVDALPIKSMDGSLLGAVAIFVDITEDVQAESHIHDVRRALEQRLTATSNAHEDLTRLAGKLGHNSWDVVESPEEIVLVAAESGQGKGKLALVVDDVQVHHVLLSSRLSNLGFAVHSANNGQEAVEAVKKHKYTLILMDCDMPVMDGYEATRTIRQSESGSQKVPIVAMTSYDRLGDREKCLAAGMDEYVTKSIDQTRLFKLVEAILKGEQIVAVTPAEPAAHSDDAAGDLDLADLEKSYGEKGLTDILPLYVKTTTILVECLKIAIAERDVRATHHYAYCIKGPSASLGCTKLSILCEKIASSALRNKWFDADFEFDSLESAFNDLGRKLESVLDDGATPSPESSQAKAVPSASVDDPHTRLKKLEQKVGRPTAHLLAKAFLEDTKDMLETTGGAMDRHETDKVQRAMHMLAGCCASMMDKEGQGLARTVEDLAVKQSWKTAGSVYLTLCESLARTRHLLKEYTK